MAYFPTEPYVFGMLTGFEHSFLCTEMWNMKQEEKTNYMKSFKSLCEKLQMTEYLDKKVINYSQGMKYKIYLISMLARNPTLIFLDEPFTSMDRFSQDFMIDYIKKNSSKTITIFSSHQYDLVIKLSNKKYIIKNKTLILSKNVVSYENEFLHTRNYV
jgi:ABC-2 type transport system ATP-binding protein